MNFFEHQDRARRQSRRLLALFLLAVVAIVAAIDLAVVVALGASRLEPGMPLLSAQGLRANLALVAGASLVTLLIIVGASLFKIVLLRAGGGEVARGVGGTLIGAEAGDPLHRRLRNVVEELALASGVPVPEIYVLEREAGINAFAAGFTAADAAIAVTRGALEKLSRNELQGVIAHEFSHILNGDMRLNIRLMGALFGILVLAIAGRRVLQHTRHFGGSRNKGAGAVLLIAFALMAAGYIGLFFGRWIKAAVSRQREYLADASAVQFTRDPDSIGGALKKIAVYGEGSYLVADSEEVGHMLFGAGQETRLFATHPPLMERIRRVDPSFRPTDLEGLADRIRRDQSRAAEQAEKAAEQTAGRGAEARRGFDAGNLIDEIGNPGWQRLAMAAAMAASIPGVAMRAASSPGWSIELLLASLVDANAELREEQLLVIARHMGGESEGRVRTLFQAGISLRPEQRLPLLEIALPNLKQRSLAEQEKLVKSINEIMRMDGQIEVFEYLLARLVTQYLWEAANPRQAARPGRRSLESLHDPARVVLAVLAMHGHADAGQVMRAYRAGVEKLGLETDGPVPATGDWAAAMDQALRSLDDLRPQGRQRLVEAMVAAATADKVVAPAELELMRAVCAALHVPVPVLGPPAGA